MRRPASVRASYPRTFSSLEGSAWTGSFVGSSQTHTCCPSEYFLIAGRNAVLSICFRQPLAPAKSPVNTIAKAILSRIPVHLNDLDLGIGPRVTMPPDWESG